jgi:hypothetical protein
MPQIPVTHPAKLSSSRGEGAAVRVQGFRNWQLITPLCQRDY